MRTIDNYLDFLKKSPQKAVGTLASPPLRSKGFGESSPLGRGVGTLASPPLRSKGFGESSPLGRGVGTLASPLNAERIQP